MSELNNISHFANPEAAEAAFYAAFRRCDLQAMGRVWAETEIICIHPGSSVLVGREKVMRSWSHILTNAEPPTLNIEVVSRIKQNGLAVHVVEEHLTPEAGVPESTVIVLATNIYCLSTDGWRLQEHHASAASSKKPTH